MSERRVHNAFEAVKASEALKASTLARLQRERERRSSRGRRGALAAACAALALAAGLGGYWLARIPVAYVSIDVNPSVELSLNRFDRIVSADACNDDGELILEGLDLKGKLYDTGIELLLNNAAMEPYLTGDAALTFTVAAASAEKEAALLSGIENSTGYRRYGGQGGCADPDTIAQAHSCGFSFGKYAAYLTLSQLDATVTAEACREMTMSEIYARIRVCQSAETEGGHHGYGSGQGHGWQHGKTGSGG